jgi:hypothetical protein
LKKLIAVSDDGWKLWQTGVAPRGNVQLATGFIEIDGSRLGAPPDPLIGSILAHCPTTWIYINDDRGRRPIDIVLRGPVVAKRGLATSKGRGR